MDKPTVPVSVVSDKAHCLSFHWYFLFVLSMILNPLVIKLSKTPDFTQLHTCSVFPLHPTPSTKDIIKIKGHRKTGQCALSK